MKYIFRRNKDTSTELKAHDFFISKSRTKDEKVPEQTNLGFTGVMENFESLEYLLDENTSYIEIILISTGQTIYESDKWTYTSHLYQTYNEELGAMTMEIIFGR